ncbi:MAG: hypothetical protein JST43_14990 [Bacteroidetes bacterium]|nr:hypothetical protein [Bacteroidota bacterium]
MSAKPKILVYWPYERTDLLVPFTKLSERFEWHFIRFRYREEDGLELPFERHYWSDYSTPAAFLKHLKPQAVVFFELSNLYSCALNIAAKQLGIPTCIQEHGIKMTFDFYVTIAKPEKQSVNKTSTQQSISIPSRKGKIHLLRYYFSLFKPNVIKFWPILTIYLLRVFKADSDRVFPKVRFSLRTANFYLLISKQNLEYYRTRDGISNDQVHYFGNPYLDDLIKMQPESAPGSEPYYLLIDEGNIQMFGISSEEKSNFFSRLNDCALSENKRLYIKLHPSEYDRSDLFTHPNIRYFKAANMNLLINNAAHIFAISSTISLPLIPNNQVILFRLPFNPFQELLESYHVRFLPFQTFTVEDIKTFGNTLNDENVEQFVLQFLFLNDGNSIQRLKALYEQIIHAQKLPD